MTAIIIRGGAPTWAILESNRKRDSQRSFSTTREKERVGEEQTSFFASALSFHFSFHSSKSKVVTTHSSSPKGRTISSSWSNRLNKRPQPAEELLSLEQPLFFDKNAQWGVEKNEQYGVSHLNTYHNFNLMLSKIQSNDNWFQSF